MVYKPSMNKVERVCGRADKIGDMFLRMICAISEAERRT